MLKKPVEPAKIPDKDPKCQLPPFINNRAKNKDLPPDPINTGRKESVTPATDTHEEPVKPAAPDPVEPPLDDYVHDDESPTKKESSDDEEHERKMEKLSDDFLNFVNQKQEQEGITREKTPIPLIRIQRYLRNAEFNPEKAAQRYVNFHNSFHDGYLENESSKEEQSRERSRSRKRDEDQNDGH